MSTQWTPAPYDSLSAFTDAYIECALWSSSDDTQEFENADISPLTLATMRNDCSQFFMMNEERILNPANYIGKPPGYSVAAMAGHDFWLTRCGHGAGFWDGDWDESVSTILTDCSEVMGNVDLYVGDDGFIHSS